ncbi:MAG: hypothetical protein H8E72_00465 [Candidatus Marinimicrobia bacterium]|nr:hypothetical protein [Candidatus Neomarinimicrobiota bacterium]
MFKFGLKRKIKSINTDIESFVPLFHRWIQEDRIPNHVMVDVANYKHIPDGPGIMLIAHEGHFSLDYEDDELGLLYIRKIPLGENISETLSGIQQILDFAVELIKIDSNVGEKVEFSDEYQLLSNDRFEYPNDAESEKILLQAASGVFNDAILSVPPPQKGARLKINIQ